MSGGLARVSPDGSVIVSDPGFGINVSGWGGAPPPPPPPTCAGRCNDGNACTTDRCVNNKCVHTRISTPENREQCQTTRCDAGRGIITERKEDGTTCNDDDFCTEEEACSSGACKGKKIEDKNLPGVSFSLDVAKLFSEYFKPIESIFGPDSPITPVLQMSGARGATESCCSEKREIVTNRSFQGSLTFGNTIEIPIPALTAPIPPKFGKLGVFITLGEMIAVEGSLQEDRCAETVDGAITGRVGFTINGAGKAIAPEDLANVSVSLQSGVTGGLVGRVKSSLRAGGGNSPVEVKAFGTFQGLTGNFTIQLANGLIEGQFNATLIEPSTIEKVFTFDIPF